MGPMKHALSLVLTLCALVLGVSEAPSGGVAMAKEETGSIAGWPREFRADSLALFGAWSWVQTYGGELGVNETPSGTGRRRTLDFRRDGTYALREHGSRGDSILYSGAFSVHPARYSRIEDGPRASMWVELKNWWHLERDQLIAYLGANTIVMYPGREGNGTVMIVSDALKTRYVRDASGDGGSLYGAWRWTRSAGSWGADIRPPSSGWARYLYFEEGGTYSYWEQDSVADYRL